MERNTGFEPATFALARRTSRVTNGLYSSPTVPNDAKPFGDPGAGSGPHHQPSPTIRDRFVPQVFRDGARPLDVAQAAVLLGWTKDAVRAACERGDLQYARDHLNAYRIPCSAVAAAAAKRKAS